MEEDPETGEKKFAQLCRGWFVGTGEGKAYLAGKIHTGEARANAELRKDLCQLRWEQLLKIGLDAPGKTSESCLKEPKGADWKVALGEWVKSHSGATNRWLGENLHMGHPQNVSKQIRAYNRTPAGHYCHADQLSSIRLHTLTPFSDLR
jgi:hypothetical protein